MKRRSKLEMKSDILCYLSQKDSRQTEITDQLKIYSATAKDMLSEMKSAGLVSQNGWIYSITTKGREISELARTLEEAMG